MYIDANIFVFATVDLEERGKDCRMVIRAIEERKISCASSLLTIDETIWAIKKRSDKDTAIKTAKAALSLPIRWMDVNKTAILEMASIYERTKLDPRDALHAATMKDAGITTIISEDSDFDAIEGVKRISATECAKKYC